jgi:hypothetical protein
MSIDRYEAAGAAALLAVLAIVAGFFLVRVEHSIALISYIERGF